VQVNTFNQRNMRDMDGRSLNENTISVIKRDIQPGVQIQHSLPTETLRELNKQEE